MRRFLLFLAVGATLSFGGQPSSGAPPTPAPIGGRIAFPMLFGDRLVTINPDGSGAAVISYSHDVSPAWSPDGSMLAVSTLSSGNGDIFLVSPDGQLRIKLTSSADREDDPSWAPCGCLLAYDRTDSSGDSAIYVVGTDGTEAHIVADVRGCDEDPAFSPGGTRIAFTSCRSGHAQIWSTAVDGKNPTRVTHDGGDDRNPAWSPDGRRIAFDGDHGDARHIYVVDADGTDEEQLTAGRRDITPAWSPDGSALAYDDTANDDTVRVMSVIGPAQAVVGIGGGAPAWQNVRLTIGCGELGTASDDILIGGDGSDVLCGDNGNDHITGGPGSDVLRGGAGEDLLDARDGAPDVVDGGSGFDTALVDAGDRVIDIEIARRPEPRNLARGRPVTASYSWADSAPEFAVDGLGRSGLWWGSYYAPQWIEVDLGRPSRISRIELLVAQTPDGPTEHLIHGRDSAGKLHLLRTISRITHDGEVIELAPRRPWKRIVAIRITTLVSPSWVAWKEIRVFGAATRTT